MSHGFEMPTAFPFKNIKNDFALAKSNPCDTCYNYKQLEFSESYVKMVSIGFFIYETEPQIFFYHSFYYSTVMCFNRFFNN